MQFTLATVIIIHIHPLLLDGVCNPVRDVSFAGRGLQPRPRRFCWTGFATPSETFLLLDGVCNPVRDVSFAGRGLQPRPRRFFSARLFFSLRGIGLPSELTA
jgi:hypothetical protein